MTLPETPYFISHLQDITEWRRAVIDLADREEAPPCHLQLCRRCHRCDRYGGRLLDCNPHWREMLGYSQADVQDLKTARLPTRTIWPSRSTTWKRWRRDVLHFTALRKRYLRADGQVVWADLSVSPLRDEQGVPVALVGTWTNITARKRTEARAP